MEKHIFREYDIRGIYERELNEENVTKLGRAIGTYFRERNARNITLGYDARLSSPNIEKWLISGLKKTGIKVIQLGLIPTPILYFSLFFLNPDGGIMITGSHNPPEYNGFKVCLGKEAIFGEQIQNIYKIVQDSNFIEDTSDSVKFYKTIIDDYANFIKDRIKIGKRNIKIVIDAGNGVGGIAVSKILKDFPNVELIPLFFEPDGRFPNHHPDPTLIESINILREKVINEKADFGIGYDGDADRIGVVDERGEIIWGDRLLIIFAHDLLKRKPGSKIVGEVKCSRVLFEEIKKAGGIPIMSKVGHSIIKDRMKKEKALLAGEMSGHIFMGEDYYGYDDAIFASLKLIEIYSNSDKEKFSDLLKGVPIYPITPEVRIPCDEKIKFELVEKVKDFFRDRYDIIDIDGVRIETEKGWALIRASNTSPVLVLRAEASEQTYLDALWKEVTEVVEKFKTELGGKNEN